MELEPPLRRHLVLMGVLFEGGLGGIAFLLGWLFQDRPFWKHWQWDLQDAGLGILVCLPMLGGFILFLYCPWRPFVRIKQFTEEVIQPMFGPCSWLDLALISFMAGVGEELFFRGVVQQTLADWLNPLGGLILASILFGFLHPFTPTYIVLAAGMGAYLGYVWMATGNLLVVIIAHGLYDFLVLLVVIRKPKPTPTS
jgi:uncharacterized protein